MNNLESILRFVTPEVHAGLRRAVEIGRDGAIRVPHFAGSPGTTS